MTTIHTFDVRDLAGQPLVVEVVRLDNSNDHMILADVSEDLTPATLACAMRLENMDLDTALTVAADVAAACGDGADLELERDGGAVVFSHED